MGTPIPPNRPGDWPCIHCWGAGKTFGVGDTPHFVYLTLHDLEPGDSYDPDADQIVLVPHLLEQEAMCTWGIDDGIFTWQYRFTADETHVSVQHKLTGHPAFIHDSVTTCNAFVLNHIQHPVDTVYMFGYALFHWMDEGLNL